MQWILLALVVVCLFLIAGRYPKVAFAIFAGLLLTGAIFLWYTSDQQRLGSGKVSAAKVKIEQMAVVPAYGGSHRFSGRIFNQHPTTTLKQVTLRMVMKDCGEDGECAIIGQESERLTIQIPAGQARDFNATLYLGKPTVSGKLDWDIEVIATRP